MVYRKNRIAKTKAQLKNEIHSRVTEALKSQKIKKVVKKINRLTSRTIENKEEYQT